MSLLLSAVQIIPLECLGHTVDVCLLLNIMEQNATLLWRSKLRKCTFENLFPDIITYVNSLEQESTSFYKTMWFHYRERI